MRGRQTLRVELAPGGVVAGTVLDGRTHTPVDGAAVLLERSTHRASDSERFLEVRTAADGTFRFTTLMEGDYQVSANNGDGARTPRQALSVSATGVHDGIVLAAAPPPRVSGRVIAPAGYPLDGVAVTLSTQGRSERHGPLDGDRRFVFDRVPPGTASIGLEWPRLEIGGDAFGESLVHFGVSARITTIDVSPNEDTVTMLDATPYLPGVLAVRVLVDGEPSVGCVVEAVEGSPQGLQRNWLALAGENGIALVPVGDALVRLRVLAADGTWVHEHAELVTAAAATVTPVTIAIDLVEGSFRPIDRTTHGPLPRAEVRSLVPFGGLVLQRRFRTDAEGRFRARLPAGPHAFEIPETATGGTPGRALLEWTRAGVRAMNVVRKK